MTPASPDPHGHTDRPTPEGWAMRAEWRAEPPSEARTTAGRALEALSRIPLGNSEAGAEEMPPIPQRLRSRWTETYGAAPDPPPRPSRIAEPSSVPAPRTVSQWLHAALRPRRLAWAGSAMALGAVAVAMLWHQPDPGIALTASSGTATTRGPGSSLTDPPCRIVLIAAPTAATARDELIAVIRHAYPTREVQVVAGTDHAAEAARREPRLVVINVASGWVTAWRNGELISEFPGSPNGRAADTVGRIEDADDSFEEGPVPKR